MRRASCCANAQKRRSCSRCLTVAHTCCSACTWRVSQPPSTDVFRTLGCITFLLGLSMRRSLGFSLMFGKFIYLMVTIHDMNDASRRSWSRALRQLDLNLLRVFDAVLQHRNLTRAAEQLAMTQPAVSNAMRRLRDALQDDVIRRHGQGVL